MTIREQLLNTIDGSDYIHMGYTFVDKGLAAKECEQVVEDIAIQFANWINVEYRELSHTYAFKRCKNTKELFEIFKQEKGL